MTHPIVSVEYPPWVNDVVDWNREYATDEDRMRVAIAVSEDVDPYSMDDVMWALTTRVNPQTDILNPIPGGRGQTFMPAERMTAGGQQWTASNTRFEGGMGIDATVPFGYENDFLRPVYPVDKVRPEDFFKPEDIANAVKFLVSEEAAYITGHVLAVNGGMYM